MNDTIFSQIICISLKKRADRRKALIKNLKAGHWPFQMPKFFTAVMPKDIKQPGDWRESPEAYAALVSHGRVAVQARLAHERGELTLILEDDCKIGPGFFEGFKRFMIDAPADWDALMLGYYSSGLAPSRYFTFGKNGKPVVVTNVGIPRHSWGMHCYCIREPMLSEWIKRLGRTKLSVDQTFSSMMCEYKVCCPLPEALVKQASGFSDVTGTMRKLD